MKPISKVLSLTLLVVATGLEAVKIYNGTSENIDVAIVQGKFFNEYFYPFYKTGQKVKVYTIPPLWFVDYPRPSIKPGYDTVLLARHTGLGNELGNIIANWNGVYHIGQLGNREIFVGPGGYNKDYTANTSYKFYKSYADLKAVGGKELPEKKSGWNELLSEDVRNFEPSSPQYPGISDRMGQHVRNAYVWSLQARSSIDTALRKANSSLRSLRWKIPTAESIKFSIREFVRDVNEGLREAGQELSERFKVNADTDPVEITFDGQQASSPQDKQIVEKIKKYIQALKDKVAKSKPEEGQKPQKTITWEPFVKIMQETIEKLDRKQYHEQPLDILNPKLVADDIMRRAKEIGFALTVTVANDGTLRFDPKPDLPVLIYNVRQLNEKIKAEHF